LVFIQFWGFLNQKRVISYINLLLLFYSCLISNLKVIFFHIIYNLFLYRYNVESLTKTFQDAIPFFKYNFFSVIIFSVIIFGTHYLITTLGKKRSDVSNKFEIEKSDPLVEPINTL